MNDYADSLLKRAKELESTGLDLGQAWGKAYFEHRIRQWSEQAGNYLEILLYGDFERPKSLIDIESLGITIYPEKLDNTLIYSAMCVVKAKVKVENKTEHALINAIRRINILLGSLTLIGWGNGACGWWSWVTHGPPSGGMLDLDDGSLYLATEGILRLPQQIRKKVDAALYWVREPGNLLRNSYRVDLLRIYTAYWNAFECLVEAVNLLHPQNKLSKTEKQRLLDVYISQKSGKFTIQDIQRCYQEFVSMGFVGKASHALEICFPAVEEHEKYIYECFKVEDKNQRLYDIRNAINHGEIDAENPDELIRIESRLQQLWMIIWRMFGRLVPFHAPLDSSFGTKDMREAADNIKST